jgi:DNA polymerase-3 subunit delta
LYKLVDQHGLQVECRLPQVARGRQKVVDQQRLTRWLVQWAAARHDVKLVQDAARLLMERLGTELGLLDQELAKLALYVNSGGKVDRKLVEQAGGGWRTSTAWNLIDAALSGNSVEAITQLDRLLQSGEHPNMLFGPISWSLRRLAAATRVYQTALRHGRRPPLSEALEEAGVPKWQRGVMDQAEQQLKQLGQERAGQLHQWLLETDLALKGSHSTPERARLALEHLIVRMDRQLNPRRKAARS